ncbi:MAG: hypothetical protein KDA78_13380, partial [Planctomycetaceae bacterium]|nr:hypothetical protein [Planctomycetaceae bacterium]
QQLQIQFNQSSQIRDLSRVELFTGEASRLRTNAPLTIPLITEFDGETLVGGLAGPLVVEMPRGLGTIVFNSLPLNNRAFQSWDALPQFYRILCQFPKLSTNSSERKSNLLTQTGLSDFKTQWDAALADFGITTPSVWIPLSLILATALIVGPVDYFLVRHLLRKPLLTWVTFPILAVLATVWGVSSPGIPQKDGVQLGASSAVMANRVTMIDYATDTHTVRVQDFTKLMLPQTGRYDVTVPHQWPAPFEVDQSFTATSAVPEATYRGYYRVSGTHLDQTTYQIAAAEGKLLAAPAYERSTILIQSVGYQGVDEAQKPQTDSIIETTLSGTSSLQLSGEIRHHLPMPITDWILAYDKLIYYVDEGSTLDELGPGTTLQFPDRNIKQRELSAYLTGTTKQLVKREKGVGEDLIIRQLDYDVFATDLEYIASLLTFHQMAGGSDYTHLTNLELTSWDMSEQLRLGRAILFGRIELPEGELAIRDEQISVGKREAFVRFVIPVNRRQTGIEKLPDYRKKNEEETEASGKQ